MRSTSRTSGPGWRWSRSNASWCRSRPASKPPSIPVRICAPTSGATAAPPAPRGDIVRIYAPSELTQTRNVEVAFPERALTQKIGGWAEVEFTISVDGTVKNVIVLNSEPKGVFDSNTVQAVRRWRFKPVVENGKTVEARSRIRLRFTPAED